ncbi:MAG: hypothetical protein AN484_06635 [Aphanizomenon flos-aquae WA102]|uniref:Uncharacterized protein n=1 Tax=Aphanizomenon flos-aquae WA102 TaxID=1710896 RepID=A0A1B7X5B1_APHFL|nr:MAG: hypothetical protein AN484_06635 [Aphanizomenon flos-aquae WA102]
MKNNTTKSTKKPTTSKPAKPCEKKVDDVIHELTVITLNAQAQSHMAMSYIDETETIINELKDHVCVLFWTSVASILLSITTALVVFIVR